MYFRASVSTLRTHLFMSVLVTILTWAKPCLPKHVLWNWWTTNYSARKYISIQSLYSFFIAVKWWVGSLQRVLKCNLYILFPSMFSVSIVDSTQKKILRKEKSKPRTLWCSSICCGLTRLRLMSTQHFDHCDDANRVVDKSTDHAKPHSICFLPQPGISMIKK